MNLSKIIALATRDGFRSVCISANRSGLQITCQRDNGSTEVTDIPDKRFDTDFVEQVFNSAESLRAVGWSVEIATDAIYFAKDKTACGRLNTLAGDSAERAAA